VQGPRLWQSRTPAGWTFISENVFYLFADDRGRPRELAPGWRVRDLEIRGTNWAWVSAPRRGSSTPFCAIKIAGAKGMVDSVVELTSLTLEGPSGARDWRAAFAGE